MVVCAATVTREHQACQTLSLQAIPMTPDSCRIREVSCHHRSLQELSPVLIWPTGAAAADTSENRRTLQSIPELFGGLQGLYSEGPLLLAGRAKECQETVNVGQPAADVVICSSEGREEVGCHWETLRNSAAARSSKAS